MRNIVKSSQYKNPSRLGHVPSTCSCATDPIIVPESKVAIVIAVMFFIVMDAGMATDALAGANKKTLTVVPSVKKVIGSSGGIVALQGTINSVSVDIPNGALATSTEITIRHVPNPTPTDYLWYGYPYG